jgi:alpha-glucosidase
MKTILFVALFGMCVFNLNAREITLASPDGEVVINVRIEDRVYYSVSQDGETLLADCSPVLEIDGAMLGVNSKLLSQKKSKIKETITPVVPLKFSSIDNICNQLTLKFANNYSIEFRAYNEGVAYRFVTDLKGDSEGMVIVSREQVNINFADSVLLHLQPAKDFTSDYETAYLHVSSNGWKSSDNMATLPILVDSGKGRKILFSETDLSDYPCLFMKSNDAGGMVSTFSGVALEEKQAGDRYMRITEEADYIARTNGKRTYPWRYFIITADDRQLVESTLPAKLAPKCELEDTSWIYPGQVSWEWWNAASPYGDDVDFISGFNLETYKYYIDFASKFGIPYIIMDEGWAETVHNPYKPNPTVDLHELLRYGKEKNVGIILWLTWLCVENNMELFETFAQWGVKGVKIDFMNRNDQRMVNYYERVASEAAKHGILVDFHGAFTPRGLEYKYPNVISYEGVRGLEQMQGCQPDNTIYLPFMRNVVGAMDFTPGAMINMQPRAYAARRPNSASVGTRTYQLALFVLFESGLQMLCDNPTLYYRNKDCTDFITSIPVTWDETRALTAEAGEVVVVAKRKGTQWFIGGITNGQERDISLKLDFLEEGREYRMTSFEDGINANRQAMDYKRKESSVNKNSLLDVKMARNGGWAAIIEQ